MRLFPPQCSRCCVFWKVVHAASLVSFSKSHQKLNSLLEMNGKCVKRSVKNRTSVAFLVRPESRPCFTGACQESCTQKTPWKCIKNACTVFRHFFFNGAVWKHPKTHAIVHIDMYFDEFPLLLIEKASGGQCIGERNRVMDPWIDH